MDSRDLDLVKEHAIEWFKNNPKGELTDNQFLLQSHIEGFVLFLGRHTNVQVNIQYKKRGK